LDDERNETGVEERKYIKKYIKNLEPKDSGQRTLRETNEREVALATRFLCF